MSTQPRGCEWCGGPGPSRRLTVRLVGDPGAPVSRDAPLRALYVDRVARRALVAAVGASRGGSVVTGMVMSERRCPICGVDLSERDPRTRACSPAHRREASRLRRLLSGQSDGPYRSTAEYTNRRRRVCANGANEA